jgi:hypothetical protein
MKLVLLDDVEIQNRFQAIEKIRAAGLMDNNLKVSFSWPLLKQCGKLMEVVPPPKKSMRMKRGQCYGNAHSRVQQGYSYIEGIIRHKESGVEISHAWNLTPTGTYVDFTIMETSQYEYFGVEVPISLRFQLGFKTSPHWYCTLPYLQLAM